MTVGTVASATAVSGLNHLSVSVIMIFLNPSGVDLGYCRSVQSSPAAAHKCRSLSLGVRSSCSSKTIHSLGAIQSHAHVLLLAVVLRITRLEPRSVSAHSVGVDVLETVLTLYP